MNRTPITKRPIQRMDVSINMEKTGAHIKRLIKESGYTMKEIMEITGITTEQTIYKWYSGKSIPSLETQLVLCILLGLRITELLVIDGEFDYIGAQEEYPEDAPDNSDGNHTTEHACPESAPGTVWYVAFPYFYIELSWKERMEQRQKQRISAYANALRAIA